MVVPFGARKSTPLCSVEAPGVGLALGPNGLATVGFWTGQVVVPACGDGPPACAVCRPWASAVAVCGCLTAMASANSSNCLRPAGVWVSPLVARSRQAARQARALGLGQGRHRLGAPGRFLDPRRRGHDLAPHQPGAGHPGHLAVARRQGVLDPVHVAAQAVELARGAQAVALLKGPDRALQVLAVARVVARRKAQLSGARDAPLANLTPSVIIAGRSRSAARRPRPGPG